MVFNFGNKEFFSADQWEMVEDDGVLVLWLYVGLYYRKITFPSDQKGYARDSMTRALKENVFYWSGDYTEDSDCSYINVNHM